MHDLISVIMPVYNTGIFLSEAIESILQQTYKNFEFIIINDGSTDSSRSIINKFAKRDSRIVVINQKNKGIVDSLNTAIGKAKGKYIARMDSDDISIKNRLNDQIVFLKKNKNVGVVSTRVELINDKGGTLDYVWPEDYKAQTPEEIKSIMINTNCIAHPAVMAKTELLKKYRYSNQKNGEDYDLWLRMLSDGVIIAKIDSNLLRYRIHSESITSKSNAENSLKKIINLKRDFLKNQIKKRKWGEVEIKVSQSLAKDLLFYYSGKDRSKLLPTLTWASRKIKKTAISIKNVPAYLKESTQSIKKAKTYEHKNKDLKNILFVLPWMTTGGADKVALDIARELKDKYNWHFITTEKGQLNNWVGLFEKVSKNITDISFIKFNKNKAKFIYKYCLENGVDKIIISNSITGYRSLPLVKRKLKKIKVIDILHGEGGKLEGGGYPFLMQPYEKHVDTHIVVTDYLKKLLINKYNNDPDKIKVIHNGIDMSCFDLIRKNNNKKIVWVGRMSPEKHPEVILKIAKEMPEHIFKLIGGGDMYDEIQYMSQDLKLSNVDIVGEKNNINKELEDCSMLVMTSEIEGFPIVLLEAGAKGLPVIAPNVGGISEYIISRKNGYMVKEYDRIGEYAKAINCIAKNDIWPNEKIRSHANEKYSIQEIIKEYEKIL